MMKKRPKNDQIWPESGIFGHFGTGLAASFGALLVGWLVIVARKTPIYFIIMCPFVKFITYDIRWIM